MGATESGSDVVNAPRWPLGSMLFLGTFGARDSPAARRYHSRAWLGLGVYGGLIVLFGMLDIPSLTWLVMVLCGATITCVIYEMWRYVSTLDELARLLQFEAMAITYLIGLAAVFMLSQFQTILPLTLHPAVFILLEPVRGLVLAWRARRYA